MKKYYLDISTIYTFYNTGKTYKYVLWEISEETFFKMVYVTHNYVYDENVGYIVYLKERRIENV